MNGQFRLACYLDLKYQLGEIDACAECLEIAVREFVATCRTTEDTAATIQRLSQKHGIRVDSVDLGQFSRRSVGLSLMAVTQAFDVFLDGFIEEHPRVQSREGRDRGETILDLVIRKLALKSAVKQDLKRSLDYRLYNYYRLLRNEVAHASAPKTELCDPASTTGELSDLRADSISFLDYARLKAPNHAASLSFDDYVLFTRAAKRLASRLCHVGVFTDDEIVSWLERHRARKGSRQRQENAIKTALRIAFGMSPGDAAPFIERIMGIGPVA